MWVGVVPSCTEAKVDFVRMEGSTGTPLQPSQLPSDGDHCLSRLLQDNYIFIRYHAAVALKVSFHKHHSYITCAHEPSIRTGSTAVCRKTPYDCKLRRFSAADRVRAPAVLPHRRRSLPPRRLPGVLHATQRRTASPARTACTLPLAPRWAQAGPSPLPGAAVWFCNPRGEASTHGLNITYGAAR